MKNKIKHGALALALVSLSLLTQGSMAQAAGPVPTLHAARPRGGSVYIVRPYYPYYYSPYWYDPFWYGPSTLYTVPREVQGTVKTEIEPKNAAVYVNGGFAGTADQFRGVFHGLHLRPGNYELEFRAPHYAPLKLKIFVAADKTIKLKERLQPLLG